MHVVVIIGAPAAGKMTVGAELSELTGYPLFHNHQAMEPSKRDVSWARQHLVEMESEHRWHSDGERIGSGRHVVLDNAHGDPASTAREIVSLLELPTR